MGKDKVENEDLIRYGDEDDVWFHVDKVSRRLSLIQAAILPSHPCSALIGTCIPSTIIWYDVGVYTKTTARRSWSIGKGK